MSVGNEIRRAAPSEWRGRVWLRGMVLSAVGALAAAPAMAAQSAAAAQSAKLSGPLAVLEADNASGGLPGLPPLPSAKNSTIFGGAIRQIDPVRDQFLLHVYGGRPMKVLFDERTQIYRDGVKIPVRDLRPADHASVQTALDGTRIYALSIHILTSIPQGHYRGRVLRYDPSDGELQLDAYPSPQPFTVLVPGTATILRKGQSTFTSEGSGRFDLRRGAIVDVTFAGGGAAGVGAMGIASQVVVLAVPGASFVFAGNIVSLNESSGVLMLVDPRDQKSYQISFVPGQIPGSGNLRVGQRVWITASYDGTAYIASNITAY